MTGNDVNTKSIHLRNGRFVSLTIGALAAVVLALMFFVVCWFLADAFYPLAGPNLLSANFLTNTGQFSLGHFFDVIDNCGLESAVVYRLDIIFIVAGFFALLFGYLVRKGIVGEGWPRWEISLGIMSLMLVSALALIGAYAYHHPFYSLQQSTACVSKKQAPSF
jgi:hypothetical protein